MNRYILLFLIIITILTLTGCWSYREIDSLYIVAGIAIDKESDTNAYNITTEFINIKDNKREQSFESVLLESKGDSIIDGVSKMIRISAKKPYWGHAVSMIISEEAARGGIMPFLDLIARGQEPRLSIDLYIAKGKPAKEILEMESISTDIRSYELGIMTNESKYLVQVPTLKAYEVINELAIPKVHIVLPTIVPFSNNGKDTNQLSGGAVFSMGKLVGFLEDEDILPYLFVKNNIESGILNVKVEENNLNETIILEIFNNNTRIIPIYKEEGIGFDISIKSQVTISELTTMTDYISKLGRDELKELAEQSLKRKVEDHIEHIREEFGFDIFGFGNIIRQRKPKLWKTLEKDWDSVFMDMDLNIRCDIQIKNSGNSLKPIKVVD